MLTNWTPDSWRKFPVVQVPDYTDAQKLGVVEKRLAGFPPLVFAGEASRPESRERKPGQALTLCNRFGSDCRRNTLLHFIKIILS